MKTVRKKILPKYLTAVKAREKNFEIRKDEDDIQVGDVLILEEHEGDSHTPGVCRKVKYVLRDVPEFGLQDGFCIIGF